jgi:hypothetical protein
MTSKSQTTEQFIPDASCLLAPEPPPACWRFFVFTFYTWLASAIFKLKMRQTNFLFLLAAGVASAALQRLQPGSGASPAGAAALLARQFNTCSSRDTCHDCYGEGYVVCDTIGCFNPEIHQQCCKDACECLLLIPYAKAQAGC